jgi:hypothetical protein
MSANPALMAVAEALVPLEFRGLRGIAAEDVLHDAARFTASLLQAADSRVTVPLQAVVLALNTASGARYGRAFAAADPNQQDALWRLLRDRPGFAQLRRVVRTAALMRLSEWEGFVHGKP